MPAATRRSGRSGCAGPNRTPKRESKLDRPIRVSDLAGRFEETGPTFKLDAIVAASAEAIHGGRTGASGLGGILDAARRVSRDLPQTDQVHEFLDFLDRTVKLDG